MAVIVAVPELTHVVFTLGEGVSPLPISLAVPVLTHVLFTIGGGVSSLPM